LGRARYRRRFDIIADIISVAGRGAKKTKIMYFANLSYLLLEKYLEETVQNGFLRFGDNGYEATEKGQAFLVSYDKFSSRSSRLNRDLERLKYEAEELEKMCRHWMSGKGCGRSRSATLG
jgi:predicted transcriptional regulator